MKRIPAWAVATAAAAPVALMTGLFVGASRQPATYDALRDTISALAAYGASDRWIMTSALVLVGLSYLATAYGLAPVRWSGRAVLALGGLGTICVAVFAQPANGNSHAHTVSATVAFAALALWPICAAQRNPPGPLLAVTPSIVATLVLVSLVAWFFVQLHGGDRGLAERLAAVAESLWPLAVVVTTRYATGHEQGDDMAPARSRPAGSPCGG